MAPDGGLASQQQYSPDVDSDTDDHDAALRPSNSRSVAAEPDLAFLRTRAEQPQFTLRALVVGLLIGILIAFSNTYFGLQTGWISGMAMPSALIGFAYFKGLRTLMCRLGEPMKRWGWGEGFSEVENVLVQTVAGSVGTMPLGCGFVGVVPALEFLLKPEETPESMSNDPEIVGALAMAEENGGLRLPLGKLILWALGLCFFGVVFAVPLRKEVIVREKLRFPSGTATALMIGVLHGGEKRNAEGEEEGQTARQRKTSRPDGGDEESQALMGDAAEDSRQSTDGAGDECGDDGRSMAAKKDWKKQIRLLTYSFGLSGGYTLLSYFLPQIHSIPFLGTYLARKWLWSLNPSPAYVGQGIIMGPATTIHMLIGAIIGWAILSPLAKYRGWASGDVGDWNTGSKGWIVWATLEIMDRHLYASTHDTSQHKSGTSHDDEEEYDAPPHQLIGMKTTLLGLALSLGFCLFAVQFSFAGIIPLGLTTLGLGLALLLSIMGVRALGETDLNPVSGISKLTQLIFALVTPSHSKNAVTINLIAGAISESGALQAGDLLQDLKTGHLLGASPKAQFYGQLIGSGVGALVSASVYKLYTKVYSIPGGLFQVPTGYVWIFTARLVTGQGLPPRTPEYAGGAALIFALLTALRIYGNSIRNPDGSKGAWWVPYVPGGIAVAVGMYNTPSFTLARTAGGVLAWYWIRWRGREETPMIVLASGLILGEGLVSIVNLGLASAKVPHF
ncbi:oligopeptide transporter-like protein [Hortaea werneckii]|nr:oligopeptide transporter-like protein [Hortaea werneckii]